jgi:hypothetical protein
MLLVARRSRLHDRRNSARRAGRARQGSDAGRAQQHKRLWRLPASSSTRITSRRRDNRAAARRLLPPEATALALATEREAASGPEQDARVHHSVVKGGRCDADIGCPVRVPTPSPSAGDVVNAEVDGVPLLWADVPGPLTAMLMFRIPEFRSSR